jgi:hypothetical protein
MGQIHSAWSPISMGSTLMMLWAKQEEKGLLSTEEGKPTVKKVGPKGKHRAINPLRLDR